MVKSTHDVHLGTPVFHCLLATLNDLLVIHRVTFVTPQIGTERAKNTAVNTNVRCIQMRVDVVVSSVAIDSLPHKIGELAQVVDGNLRIVHRDAIVEVKPFARFDFFLNRLQFWINGMNQRTALKDGLLITADGSGSRPDNANRAF